jgi:rhodanese-related sulfurtransferase
MLNREDAVLIDIRDASDYDAGHIINAKNIPRAELKSRLDELKKFKERPIVVYCANGSASTAALRELSSAGFEQVHSLKGGLSAWRSDNLPLT